MNGRDRPRPRAAVDARESEGWRSGKAAVPAGASKRRVRADPAALEAADLELLPDIHALLHGLNDAYAGGAKVQQLIEKIPVLAARCVRRARKRFPAKGDVSLGEALTLIGNIGLESELLQLLEDLTMLRSELDAAREAGATKKG